jgi:hypothetical protein
MDAAQFDRLALSLTRPSTRRSIVAVLGALGLTGLLARDAAACGAIADRCGRPTDPECSSGRCVRKRNSYKRFCRPATGQGICTIDSDSCASSSSSCGTPNCACFRRQNGASVCAGGDTFCGFAGNCTDTKCRELLHNKKAFCAMSQVDACCSGVTGVCVLPCPEPDLPPP